MTKAFTSALGYGITVRGYIDEDDKLVLLEPEGGGGGGDLTIAIVTVESSTLEDGAEVSFEIPIANDDDNEGPPSCIPAVGLVVGATVKVPLYKGAAMSFPGEGVTVTVESGDASLSEMGQLIITGDCTISVASA